MYIPDIFQARELNIYLTYDRHMTLLFEFGRPLPAAEMRLKCCGTQVLDGKGVYCSAHNAAVPSGIRDSESVGPGQTRIRPGAGAVARRWSGWSSNKGKGTVIVLVNEVILAAGAGVALTAGACALAVLRRPRCRRHSLRWRCARRSARRWFNWVQ